jgi:hypothetical protein
LSWAIGAGLVDFDDVAGAAPTAIGCFLLLAVLVLVGDEHPTLEASVGMVLVVMV